MILRLSQAPVLKRKKDRVEKKEKGLRGYPFHLACANNRLDLVKGALLSDENYDINEKFGDVEESPLMFACYNGHIEVRLSCPATKRILAFGGKAVYLNSGDNKKLFLQLPYMRSPYGLSAFTDEDAFIDEV